MQRVLEAATAAPSTCVGCGTPSTEDRCGHCGVAARAGPYRVLRVLARSPHGAMYLAEDGAGAKVALKELVFALVPTTQELDAFTREAELLQALVHPRIPRFLGSFTVGQGVSTRLYLAQQYLPGLSLTQRLAQEHLDEAGVLDLARQALHLLHYLHGRSPVVVHRDVKPDNFILDADGALSLVDFGAARSVRAAGTHRATLVGTFGYMAPEQLGGTVDARSDLYGLGATLVHLLTRTPPERLLGPGMTLDFQPHVNVSAKTERFLSRLVAARPDQRFASASEALAYLDGRSVAPAPGLQTRPRGVVAVAVAFAAGLALVAGLFTFASASRLPPRTVEKPVPAVPPDLVVPAQPLPAPGAITFDWIQAKWEFGKPGHWVLDQSGRGHHALLPTTGYTNEFFGLEWDGTTGLTTPDSEDFAPTGPFTLAIDVRLKDEPLQKPVTVISRGDPNGKFAWAVQLVPAGSARKLRFSIADEAGQVSTVEGLLEAKAEGSWYVSFDPKTGEQKISVHCVTLAKKLTTVRPARELPQGSKLQLITGLRGIAHQIELMRGLMRAAAEPNCSYSGERLGED